MPLELLVPLTLLAPDEEEEEDDADLLVPLRAAEVIVAGELVVVADDAWQAAAWQAAAAAATAEIEFNREEVDEEVDMMEDEVEPVSLVVSAPTNERTEARRVRQFRSGI
jgi:hypothetical protein